MKVILENYVVSTLRIQSGVCDSTFISTAKVLLSHHRNLGVEEVGDGLSLWPQTFSISLSISWVITGAFDGLLMTQASLLWDAVHASCERMGQNFWHQFPPPISGPCHHWWPLWRFLNMMSLASGASCTLSAPLGWGWVDWTMTSLCGCGCGCLCLGVRAKFGKRAAEEVYVYWILKHPELSGWSVKMWIDDIYDV